MGESDATLTVREIKLEFTCAVVNLGFYFHLTKLIDE